MDRIGKSAVNGRICIVLSDRYLRSPYCNDQGRQAKPVGNEWCQRSFVFFLRNPVRRVIAQPCRRGQAKRHPHLRGKLFPAASYRMESIIRLSRRLSISMPFALRYRATADIIPLPVAYQVQEGGRWLFRKSQSFIEASKENAALTLPNFRIRPFETGDLPVIQQVAKRRSASFEL